MFFFGAFGVSIGLALLSYGARLFVKPPAR